jgi:hypothetical protein
VEVAIDERTFKASFTIINAPVKSRLWLKWKGRKVPGWRCTRQYFSRFDPVTKTRSPDGAIKFVCTDRAHFADMTPEKIEEIIAMISVLKGMPE